MPVQRIEAPNIPALGVYSHAYKVTRGSLIYVSGCVPVDENGNTVGKGDPALQMRQTLTNIKAILAAAEAGLENVIKVTVFNTNLDNREAMNKVRLEMFGDHQPASTHIQISRLIDPDWLVEVECVAALPE
jgi:reactive intermediate/imine deaminase